MPGDGQQSGFSASGVKTLLAYGAMIAATIAGFFLIRWTGRDLVAPEPVGPVFGSGAGRGQAHPLLHVLLALVVIIVASRAVGALFKYLHQPHVIGEVLAGIMLGPSLFGRLAPEGYAFLLPQQIAPYLQVIAQVGVILFMFLVGLELDTGLLLKKAHATLAISHASIVAPFLLGSGLALWLYPRLSSHDVPFGVFAMFLGVSLSVTAFPVLARILTDRGLQKTRLGVIALSCAAVDDVTAWCLLALIVGVAQSQGGSAAVTIGLALAYVAVMFVAVRPLVQRFVRRWEVRGSLPREASALALIGLLLSALATESIGIHALFGSFLLGALIPHDSLLARDLTHKIEDLVLVLLLPAFFALTGMRTQIGLVSGVEQWAICAVVIGVACLGKFGGSSIAARLSGLSWRDSASIGVLMNTRGLMELIVLNLGLDLKVITPTMFAMLVIMALVTTFATTPVLHLLGQGREESELEPSHSRTG